jgi:hypothetical protein
VAHTNIKSPSFDELFILVSQIRANWKTVFENLVQLSVALDELGLNDN